MILSGCNTVKPTVDDAAVSKAVAQAPTVLPQYPDYCAEHVGRVVPKLNEPVYGPQERWNIVADNDDKRKDWCARWYDATAQHAAGVTQPNAAPPAQ